MGFSVEGLELGTEENEEEGDGNGGVGNGLDEEGKELAFHL